MKAILAVLILALPLTGCLTAEQRMQQAAALDDSKCRSYGSTPGSPAYVACRTQLDATRTQAQAIIASTPTTCVRSANVTNCY